MAKYKLGKLALITAPGVILDDVIDVDLNASGDEVDITVFGDTEKQIGCGLLDVTVEVTATNHSATVGATGPITVGGMTAVGCVVVDVKNKVSPKGRHEYTISYAPTVS
ncbi:MAG: hypothetical protein EBT04_14140 [Betaproteobacteria bacterium]|nr:hypothetical protein [Betaproteobacteria bacterium]